MSEPQNRLPTIHVELSLKTLMLGIGLVAAVWLFLHLWPVLLAILVALMIVGMLNPFIAGLEGRGLRRSYAMAIVFGGLFIVMVLFLALTLPRFVSQFSEMVDRLPQMQAQMARQLDGTKLGGSLARSLRELRTAELVAEAKRLGLAYSSSVIEIIAYAFSALFLALYLIVDRDRMRGALFALLPRTYHVRMSRILLNLEVIVGGYMRGQLVTSAMMAVFTFAVLSIARVPNALALALFAGIVDVLPYIGALLVCAPAFLASLSRGPVVALIVLGVLAIYQEVESRFLVPRIYGKVLRLPAAVVMVSLLVGGKLLGILGALLALPVAAGLRMIAVELRVELPGEVVEDSEIRRRDEQGEREFHLRASGAPAAEAAAIAVEIAVSRREQDASDAADPAEVPLSSGLKKS